MSDILTRLLLDTKGYDGNLLKAKKSTENFTASITGKLGGAVTKLAGGLGLAMGAADAFNKVIRSSQTLSDTLDNSMNALKGSVDAFFQSLATGNWDAFNGGLLQTIRNMRDLSAMQDALADAKLTMGFDTKKFEREYVKLEAIINDETKTKGEREAAFADMQKLVANFKERVDKTAKGAADTLVKEMNSKFGQNFTLEDLEKYITEVNNEFLNTETLQRLNEYKEKLDLFKKSGGSYVIGGIHMTTEQFIKQNEELEKMRILQDDNDESRKNMLAQLEYAVELQRRADDYLKRSLEKQIKVAGLNKGGSVNGESAPVVGSIAELDARIKALQTEYANTASAAAREAVIKTIMELQNQKGLIELHARVSMPDSGKSTFSMPKNPLATPQKIELPITKENVKDSFDYADGLNAVASALGSINASTGEGAEAVLGWAASVATASAQVVSSIRTVVAAKTAEAAASSGASAASTPVIGWLMVGAAIASALTAFAKIPKFAEGGVVGGSSYFGDKLIARVNSGETILTKNQAARALSMMNGNNVRISGELKLSGKDIYISLRNYMASSGNKL